MPLAACAVELAAWAAKKYQLPDSFVRSVMKAESGFQPNAVSPKGAIGLMQLMPDTARALGVDRARQDGRTGADDEDVVEGMNLCLGSHWNILRGTSPRPSAARVFLRLLWSAESGTLFAGLGLAAVVDGVAAGGAGCSSAAIAWASLGGKGGGAALASAF